MYKTLASLAGLLGWPLFYYHLKSRGQGESFRPRLGLEPPPLPPPGSPRLWIHGVSVGEILAAGPLVAELKILLPQASFIITTGTETGQAVARRQFTPSGALVCYFPLDIPWAVNKALDTIKPDIFVALESEVWPNFLNAAHGRGVRLALMNARLSDRSFRRYSRYKKYLSDFINLFEIIAAGSREDYRRLASLGFSGEKLVFTGNLKVDALLARRCQVQNQAGSLPPLPASGYGSGSSPGALAEDQFLKALGLQGEPVLLAASTHPGEEEVVLGAYEALRVPYPALLLILAPRHPERAETVGDILARRGLGFQRWQSLKSGAETRRQAVVLVDTVGDLFCLYAAADVAFVGGSLVSHGGQNILEPAVWGLAPLYGPHFENFRWAVEILREAGAGTMVQDAASLTAAARYFLDNPSERRRLGEAALTALSSHQGAARRQAGLVAGLVRE
ncbi:MAG: 3-deoxy-D-manno-octulosonic acid transferase [Desulfobaccales bacterium]